MLHTVIAHAPAVRIVAEHVRVYVVAAVEVAAGTRWHLHIADRATPEQFDEAHTHVPDGSECIYDEWLPADPANCDEPGLALIYEGKAVDG